MSENNGNTPNYATLNAEYAQKFATMKPENDSPIWMINLVKYREQAQYADGINTSVSGRDAAELYAPQGPLAEVGARVVFAADVDVQIIGTPKWDRVGIVRYPSRRAFIELQKLPSFQKQHTHKDAGVEETIVMGGLPQELIIPYQGSETWDETQFPPDPNDPPVAVVHVIRYTERQLPDGMKQYQEVAGPIGALYGVRQLAYFTVEGTILGDGRVWDEVRFNIFPSKAAFLGLVTNPERLKAQGARQSAMEDTFTMITRPLLNEFSGQII